MTTILPIFRKDLPPPVAPCGGTSHLDGAFRNPRPYIRQRAAIGQLQPAGWLPALPLACWNLIIAVIHEEKLPGDRQYWLTRPYSWKDLLAAKALFVAAFINLPLFVWHVGAFAAVGVPLGEHLPALLWRQLFFSAFYILPVAALAAITRSLGQLILTGPPGGASGGAPRQLSLRPLPHQLGGDGRSDDGSHRRDSLDRRGGDSFLQYSRRETPGSRAYWLVWPQWR